MFSTNALDWALIIAYFAFLAGVWLKRVGKSSPALEYLVAGRRVTLPALQPLFSRRGSVNINLKSLIASNKR